MSTRQMSMLRKKMLARSFILGLALIAGIGSGTAQEKESELKRLMLADFETKEKSCGLPQSSEYVKEGQFSGEWRIYPEGKLVHVSKSRVKDISKYDYFSFWAYSEKATNQSIHFICYSEREKESMDYYFYRFRVNWTGWKRFIIPLKQFKKARKPLGWNSITQIFFSAKWSGKDLEPDTILYLDKIELIAIPEPESVDI